MDIHHKIVAVLHMIVGALALIAIALISLFFGAFSGEMGLDPGLTSLLLGFGTIIAVAFGLFSLGEVIAAFYLFNGSRGARVWITIYSALHLFNFPLGTALGVYSLWALFRPQPNQQTLPNTAQS